MESSLTALPLQRWRLRCCCSHKPAVRPIPCCPSCPRGSCGRRCPCLQVQGYNFRVWVLWETVSVSVGASALCCCVRACALVCALSQLRPHQAAPHSPRLRPAGSGRRIWIQSSSRAHTLCIHVRLWEVPSLAARRGGSYLLLTAPLVLKSQVATSCMPACAWLHASKCPC